MEGLERRIADLVAAYARSIDEADTNLAGQVWSTTENVTLIHPRAHERGWNQVKAAFYEKTMLGRFSTRKLTVVDLGIYPHGDTVVAQFYWIFYAVFCQDGSAHQKKGRETQVDYRVNNQWRLFHVHYSGMPVTGDLEGF